MTSHNYPTRSSQRSTDDVSQSTPSPQIIPDPPLLYASTNPLRPVPLFEPRSQSDQRSTARTPQPLGSTQSVEANSLPSPYYTTEMLQKFSSDISFYPQYTQKDKIQVTIILHT